MSRERTIRWAGRILLTAIFVGAGIDKVRNREGTLQYMGSKGMPPKKALLNGAIAMELGVAPAVALGVLPRFSAPALAAFLGVTSVVFHDFWRLEGRERQEQTIHFLKNMAIIGGLAVVALEDLQDAREIKAYEAAVLEEDRPDYLDAA